jgi:hypothetical protein
MGDARGRAKESEERSNQKTNAINTKDANNYFLIDATISMR